MMNIKNKQKENFWPWNEKLKPTEEIPQTTAVHSFVKCRKQLLNE